MCSGSTASADMPCLRASVDGRGAGHGSSYKLTLSCTFASLAPWRGDVSELKVRKAPNSCVRTGGPASEGERACGEFRALRQEQKYTEEHLCQVRREESVHALSSIRIQHLLLLRGQMLVVPSGTKRTQVLGASSPVVGSNLSRPVQKPSFSVSTTAKSRVFIELQRRILLRGC